MLIAVKKVRNIKVVLCILFFGLLKYSLAAFILVNLLIRFSLKSLHFLLRELIPRKSTLGIGKHFLKHNLQN